ncbi:hypothetical protein Scep_029843 [Stephania cephalantha]|uniref:Uncharacterized protein n=1 Tax=Stephania cephalantha TaxID=152367 RepID=A0AAP0E2Z1_9MAGN
MARRHRRRTAVLWRRERRSRRGCEPWAMADGEKRSTQQQRNSSSGSSAAWDRIAQQPAAASSTINTGEEADQRERRVAWRAGALACAVRMRKWRQTSRAPTRMEQRPSGVAGGSGSRKRASQRKQWRGRSTRLVSVLSDSASACDDLKKRQRCRAVEA